MAFELFEKTKTGLEQLKFSQSSIEGLPEFMNNIEEYKLSTNSTLEELQNNTQSQVKYKLVGTTLYITLPSTQ